MKLSVGIVEVCLQNEIQHNTWHSVTAFFHGNLWLYREWRCRWR